MVCLVWNYVAHRHIVSHHRLVTMFTVRIFLINVLIFFYHTCERICVADLHDYYVFVKFP